MPRRLLFLIATVLPVFAQNKPVTLESLKTMREAARAPVDGQPTWAPDGKTFLFQRGQTLRIYDPASKTSRELVSVEALDAAAVKRSEESAYGWTNRYVEAGGLEFSASGKDLLYSTGGDLFLIHVEDGKWKQLTKTPEAEEDAKLSPDGKLVAFRRASDLYTLEIATGKETRLTRDGSETLLNGELDWVYPEELELSTAYWWSPDSKSIAYLQFDTSREPVVPHEDVLGVRARYEPERYPQAGENNADVRLGVVSASGGATRWLEVGDTRNTCLIARAGWMPDSRSVYIVRMPRVQNRLELISIGVESNMPTLLLREADPYWINLDGDVRFLKDGKKFLWTSEKDGYRHIYLHSIEGKELKRLTKGDWEVRRILAMDDKRVLYLSNEGSPLEQHLYSVKLDGGGKQRLDKTEGFHSVSMGPGDAYYLDTVSTLKSPSRTTLHSSDGEELGVYREADTKVMDEYEILPTEIVTFKGADGTELRGRIIKPAGFQAGKKYPVIVTVYGGPGVPLPIVNRWPGVGMDQVYAHKGYVVWECENRGGQGRGHRFESAIFRNLGAAELADQVAGVRHLISLGYVDEKRIGIQGWSYGGFMTLNALLNAPDVFRCGISGAPVTSWMNYDTIYTERYMGLPKENAEAYKNTALPPKAENLKARLMLVHNYEDDNVLFQNSLQMTNALQNAGKIFEYMLYSQKTHGVGGKAAEQMNASMLDFFERNLK
ncbi:MAG TPA: S9 family peptidase [Bryobacteraceae bacterium]|nr:S9 family peptidase [Bryobacteraceae bacterium]